MACTSNPKKKRKLWDITNMVEAMKAVKEENMTVSKAAREYHVPRKSLENRVKARVELEPHLVQREC